MQFKRMFTTDAYRGTRGYLRTQKIYEILRTVLYFAISLSLFIAGWVSTEAVRISCPSWRSWDVFRPARVW